MFGNWSRENQRMLQNAHDKANESLTLIRQHVDACNTRAERAAQETTAFRSFMQSSLEGLSNKVEGTRRWVMGLVLSGLCTVIMMLITALGWGFVHYVVKA